MFKLPGRRMKINWSNLNKLERAKYMRLQMSPQGNYDNSGYLPEDCGECGACGTPTLGAGWCSNCFNEFQLLRRKLIGD